MQQVSQLRKLCFYMLIHRLSEIITEMQLQQRVEQFADSIIPCGDDVPYENASFPVVKFHQ